jgi:hypothetical protein
MRADGQLWLSCSQRRRRSGRPRWRARTLARPGQVVSMPSSMPPAAQGEAQTPAQTPPAIASASTASHHEGLIAASQSGTGSTPQPPAGAATLVEVPAAKAATPDATKSAAAPTATEPTPPVQKKATKKRHTVSRYASRGGPIALFPGKYYNRPRVDIVKAPGGITTPTVISTYLKIAGRND